MTVKVTYTIPEKWTNELLKESDKTGLSKSAIVTIALNEYFEKRGK